MEPQDLKSRIQACTTDDALAQLAVQLAAETLDAPRAITHEYNVGDEQRADKAGIVILELRELVLRPLLGEFDETAAGRRVAFLEAALRLQLLLQQGVWNRLGELLADKKPIAHPTLDVSAPADAASRRMCDEAYVWIRRLAKVDGSNDPGSPGEDEFLAMKVETRDAAIRTWLQGRLWEALREKGA